MSKLHRVIVAVAGGMLLVATGGTAEAALDKCQKAIQKETQKLSAKITKALNKCTDAAAKQVAKGAPLSDVTAKCNDGLAKAIDPGNPTSAMAKALGKLAQIGPSDKAKCSDQDLQALGHLPEGTFGDLWTRIAAAGAFRVGYEDSSGANAQLNALFRDLDDAGGCALCAKFRGSPCYTHTCSLSVNSEATTNFAPPTAPTAIALSGAIPVTSCILPEIMGGDIYPIVGGPARGFDEVVVGGGISACVTTFRTVGFTDCRVGANQVDTDLCQDHVVELVGGLLADECASGADFCNPPAADTDGIVGLLEGGACSTLTLSAGTPGESFFLATTEIVLSTGVGADGVRCTEDDPTLTPPMPNTIPQTTGNASATIKDANPISTAETNLDYTVAVAGGGTPFNCDQVVTSNLSGGKSVNAFPALDSLLGADLITTTVLECQ